MSPRRRPRARFLNDDGKAWLLGLASIIASFALAIAIALHPELF